MLSPGTTDLRDYPILSSLFETIGNKAIAVSATTMIAAKEIQGILRKSHFYNGVIDGLPGDRTCEAYAKWKSSVYMALPTLLGRSSIGSLLEGTHPVSEQPSGIKLLAPPNKNAGSRTGESMTLPNGDRVYENEYITTGYSVLTWGEFTKSCSRVPETNTVLQNTKTLVPTLQWIRDKFQSPLRITSGYRPPAVNRAIGGATHSRHMAGDAVDIYSDGDMYRLLEIIKASPVTGIGLGYSTGGGNFWHVDTRPTIRVIFGYG